MLCHRCSLILSGRVPVCAAISFFRSLIVSVGLVTPFLPALDSRLIAHAVVDDDFDHQRISRRVFRILYCPLVILVHFVVHTVDDLDVGLGCRLLLELVIQLLLSDSAALDRVFPRYAS